MLERLPPPAGAAAAPGADAPDAAYAVARAGEEGGEEGPIAPDLFLEAPDDDGEDEEEEEGEEEEATALAEAKDALLSRVAVAEGEEGEDAAICGAAERGTGPADTEGGGERGEDATIRGAAQGERAGRRKRRRY